MDPNDISKVVRDVVDRVVKRLEDATHGGLATPADERMFGERRVRLQQAVAEGACRLTPQAIPLDECGDLAALTEIALLRPDAREAEVRGLCREAIERGFASVCVGLEWIEVAAASLKGTNVRVCAPVGFPLGGISTEFKTAEIRRAVALGADEVDVVMNIGRLRAGDYRGVVEDLQAGCRAAQGRPVKAVIEAAELTAEQKVAASILAKAAGTHFIKSSTSFGPDAVTVGDVAAIRAALAGKTIAPRTPPPEWAARVGAVVCVAVD